MKLNFKTFIRDSTLTLQNYNRVVSFTREHELWKGITAYKWLSKLLIVGALIISLKFLDICIQWWTRASGTGLSLASVGGFIDSLFKEGYNLFAIGGMKYIILILMEVVIFHFARRTLEVLTGDKVDHSFKTFMKAQMRMIGVAVYSFIMESILSIVAGIVLSILMMGTVKPLAIILIQCYFLGFAIVDNYNEIYDMTLKQSARFTKEYWGVALVTGVLAYIMMLVPLIGTILGPLAGAIAATITMHQLTKGGSEMDWVFEEV